MTRSQTSHWDWQSAFILVFLILTVAVRLELTRWAVDLGYVEAIAIAGTVLGLLLGVGRFSGRQAALLATLYTVFYLPMAASNILDHETSALAKLSSLAGRIQISAQQLANAQPVTDALFFVTQMAVLLWLVGVISGYMLVRTRDVNRVVIAPTLVILIIQYYDGLVGERIWSLAIYFFLVLILVGRVNLLRSRDRWLKEGVIAGTQPEFDLNRFMLLFSLMIILFSWLLPYPSEFRPLFYRGLNAVQEGSSALQIGLENLFSALTPSIKLVTPNRFPERYGLGEKAETGDQPIFKVILNGNPDPHYWPVRVYKYYQETQWLGSPGEDTDFDPGLDVIPFDHYPDALEHEVTIKWISQPIDLLIKPINSPWVSRSVNIRLERLGEMADPILLNARPDVQNGDTYSARYFVENLTQRVLKEAGSEYPEGMLEGYLDLGSQPSQRIAELARQVTAGAATNYEKASLVTRHLRDNYEYADSVGPLPEGVDPVEWFLFDGKKGYCNYYASAEVLMLRSLGIPARLVVGYTGGEMDEDDALVFQKKNTHAWPEVYFPGIGWLEFEPTASIDPVVWPTGETSVAPVLPITGSDFSDRAENPGVDVELDAQAAQEQVAVGYWLSPTLISWLLGVIGLLALAALLYRSRRAVNLYFAALPEKVQRSYTDRGRQVPDWVTLWAKWNAAERIERQFSVVNLSLKLLGGVVNMRQTPADRARMLSQVLPEASKEIGQLYQELEGCLFRQGYLAEPNKSLVLAARIGFKTIRKRLSILAFGR